jgi:hypothetical protein
VTTSLEKAIERRAREHLRDLTKRGAAGPILPTTSDVEAAGVPAERVQIVLSEILALRTARDDGDQRTLWKAEELARAWASEWGAELRPPDDSAAVQALVNIVPRMS